MLLRLKIEIGKVNWMLFGVHQVTTAWKKKKNHLNLFPKKVVVAKLLQIKQFKAYAPNSRAFSMGKKR